MRVIVDHELCEGNGVCVKKAPRIFRLGDDDQAQVLIAEPGEAMRAELEAAVRGCPRQAIRVEK